ncbi:MAG: 1-phosphofructokinase family hexose kinase [Brevinema sp.]
MIVTVTLNPAIDFHLSMDQFTEGKMTPAKENYFYAGGKGINVSRVLKNIGFDSKALAFLGGFTGNFIKAEVKEFIDPIEIADRTRINTKIKTATHESEIAGVAPTITQDECDRLIEKMKSYHNAEAVILSGSVPKTLPHNINNLIAEAVSYDTKIVVDTRGEALKEALKIPNLFFIKPNKDEIGEFFDCEVRDNEHALELALQLKNTYNIPYIIVSLGSEGAYLLSEEGIYFADVLKGTLISSVGAGDSLVAGFVGEYLKTKDAQKAFAYGIACGAGTAFSHGLVTKETADELAQKVQITKVK